MKKVCDMYTLGVPVYTKRTVCCNTPCIWMKVWNLLHGYCIFADFDLYQIQSLRKSFKVRFLKKILEKPISPKKLPPIFSKQIGFKISSRYDPNPNSTAVAERGRAAAGGRWTLPPILCVRVVFFRVRVISGTYLLINVNNTLGH